MIGKDALRRTKENIFHFFRHVKPLLIDIDDIVHILKRRIMRQAIFFKHQ